MGRDYTGKYGEARPYLSYFSASAGRRKASAIDKSFQNWSERKMLVRARKEIAVAAPD
jgi:hypothetical protein